MSAVSQRSTYKHVQSSNLSFIWAKFFDFLNFWIFLLFLFFSSDYSRRDLRLRSEIETMSSNSQVNPRKRRYDSQLSDEVNEPNDKGPRLCDVILPPELIERILCFADEKTVLNCRCVCMDWNEKISDYVLRRRAEIKTGCTFSKNTPHLGWKDFYSICTKLNQNLIKNHSGEKGLRYWRIDQNYGNNWAVEKSLGYHGFPVLPKDPEFVMEQHSFVNSFGRCRKQHTIDLIKSGFPVYVLDQMQLSIEVSSN